MSTVQEQIATPEQLLTNVANTLHNACIQPYAQEAVTTVRNLAGLAMEFATVERVPRYNPEHREDDAQHSFMLALVATELAATYYPDLDAGLVSQFSTVHDLVELETKDTPTYTLDAAGLAIKHNAEQAALRKLCRRLPQYTALLLERYEKQVEPEARFVRLVDKILPIAVDILGPGAQIMREDYSIHTTERLNQTEAKLAARLHAMFPEQELSFLHVVRGMLAQEFSDTFANGITNP